MRQQPQHGQHRTGLSARVPLSVGVGAVALGVLLVACHTSVERHNAAIHETNDYEEYCVDTSESSLDQNSARTFLANTLYGSHYNGDPNDDDRDWEQIDGTRRIYWVPEGKVVNCEGVFNTWILYRYKDSTPECGGYSCVGHYDRVCDGDHCHYNREVVTLKTSHVQNEDAGARHTINHETGHVLGLLDPTNPNTGEPCWNCGVVSNDFLACLWRDSDGNRRWVYSIMHSSAYCGQETVDAPPYPTNLEWPAVYDRSNVAGISQQ